MTSSGRRKASLRQPAPLSDELSVFPVDYSCGMYGLAWPVRTASGFWRMGQER